MTRPAAKDLIVLTADKDALLGITELLPRADALQIRAIAFHCVSHPLHDAGVVNKAHEFLRPFLKLFTYVLVVFDLEGCGQEKFGAQAVEQKVTANLTVNGWQDRCAAVAINPELEAWVWDEALHLSRILGQTPQELRGCLQRKGYMQSAAATKPLRPKEALEEVRRIANYKKSSALFQDLARTMRITGCTDPAFGKFRAALQTWFPGSR